MHDVPGNFELLTTKSPFNESIGPIYKHKTKYIYGTKIQNKHCNLREHAHGGLISAFADFGMGYSIIAAAKAPVDIVTVSLTVDYIDGARLGEWLELDVALNKIGNKMAFAQAHFHVNDRGVATASSVFSIIYK